MMSAWIDAWGTFALGQITVATIVLVLAIGLDRWLDRRARASARHALWTCTFAAILLLPVAEVALPGLPILPRFEETAVTIEPAPAVPALSTPTPVDRARPPAASPPPSTSERLPSLVPVRRSVRGRRAQGPAPDPAAGRSLDGRVGVFAIAGAWLVGALVALILLGRTLIAERRVLREATRLDEPWPRETAATATVLGLRRPVAVGTHLAVGSPLSGGLRRPAIVLPTDADSWCAERRSIVLTHELAHVRQRDAWRQLLARVAIALYWFHPLMRSAWRRATIAREQACDDTVLAVGAKPSAYAGHLLALASPPFVSTPATTLAMGHPTDLERRLLVILSPERPRRAGGLAGLSILVLLLATAVLVAAEPAPEAPEAPTVPKAPVASSAPTLSRVPEAPVAPIAPPEPVLGTVSPAPEAPALPDLPAMPESAPAPTVAPSAPPSPPSADARPAPAPLVPRVDATVAPTAPQVPIVTLAPPAPPSPASDVTPVVAPPAPSPTPPARPAAPPSPSQSSDTRAGFSYSWTTVPALAALGSGRPETSCFGGMPGSGFVTTGGGDVHLRSGDRHHLEHTFSSNLRICVHQQGDVDLATGSPQPGASLLLESERGEARMQLLISGSDLGEPLYTWTAFGSQQPFDDRARAWRDAMLAVAVDLVEIAELRGEVGSLRGEIGSLRGEEGALRGEIGAIHGEQGALRGEIGALAGEKGALRAEIGAIRAELATAASLGSRPETDARIEAIEAQIADLDSGRVEALEARLADFDAGRIAHLEARIADLDTDGRIQALEARIEDLDADRRIEALERRLEDHARGLETALTDAGC